MSSNTKQAEQKRQAAKQQAAVCGVSWPPLYDDHRCFPIFLWTRSLMFFQCSLAKFGSPSNTSARWWRLWWWEMRNLKTILNLCYKWALFILLSIGTAMTLSTQIPFAIDATKWSVIGTSLVQAKGGSTWRDTWQECGMCRTLPNLWKWQWAIRTLLTAFWISYHGVACVSWWEFEWYWIFFARTHAHFSSRFVTTCNRQTFNSPIAYMPMSTRINDNTMLTSWKTFKWRRNFFIFWGR